MIKSCKKPPVYFPTVTGAICSFNSQYAGLPLKSCVSQITGYQEGTGTPSPSNVRNLVSFSSASLYVSAKNIIDINDAHITSQTFTSNFLLKAGTYTISANYNNVSDINGYLRLNTRYEPITQLASLTFTANDSGRLSASFTLENDSVCRIALHGASVGYDFYVSDIMLEVGDSETSFEPYNGNTHLFTFGTDIYSGSIDWERGVVTGTHILKNWSDLTWVLRSAEVGRWRTVINDIKQVTGGSVLSSLISDKAETVTANAFNNRINTIYLQANLNNVELVTGDADNAPSSGQLAYELATPIEIPLGGVNLLTQEGQNNIFAVCDNTTLEYLKAGR